jgi:hypothetical protein
MYSKQELLDEIERLAEGGVPPTLSDLKERGRISTGTFYNHFESYNDALKQAGYQPHRSHADTGIESILRQIRNLADEIEIAPTARDFDTAANVAGSSTVHRRTGSYFEGVIRAGVRPAKPRPLTECQFRAVYEAAKDQPPKDELVTLLMQFTGLTAKIVSEISEQWIQIRPDATILTVPPRLYRSDNDYLWQIEIPETFQGDNIGLSELLNWYLETYDKIDASQSNVKRIIYDVTSNTEIDRREVEKSFHHEKRVVPEVRPVELKITSGIIMARNGAPANHIRQQLGLRHLDSIITVDHIFTWCEVHGDDFTHPDHEPVGLYLDPDTGEAQGIESGAD